MGISVKEKGGKRKGGSRFEARGSRWGNPGVSDAPRAGLIPWELGTWNRELASSLSSFLFSLYIPPMWSFLRRQLNYFLIGFVVTFVIYLFIRFDPDKVFLGVVLGAIGGTVLSGGLFMLERRFPDQAPPPAE